MSRRPMLFRDLYNIIETETAKPFVRFERLRQLINERHVGVGTINVRPIKYPTPNHQAHYLLLDTDRTSPYEEEFHIAEIRYCDALNAEPYERRFALTKELMHVFDSGDEMTNSRERFIRLMREIQNEPLAEHASRMYDSELYTKWMAVIILCPKPLRNGYLQPYRDAKITDFEIADELQVPEWVVPYMMDDYYEDAFNTLMNKI